MTDSPMSGGKRYELNMEHPVISDSKEAITDYDTYDRTIWTPIRIRAETDLNHT